MDYTRINRIREKDFDYVVETAGGTKINTTGSQPGVLNADYMLNEAIIELKIIREEGLEKQLRQEKIASIFNKTQPGRPVVVLDPNLLSNNDSRAYYNLMEQPIKTAIKKAAKQLKATRTRMGGNSTTVLVILNDGYTALTKDEFRYVVVNRIYNDTSRIDFAIIGGIYYYSDRFDSFFLSIFELLPVNLDKTFPSYDVLLGAWNKWVEKEYMTSVVRGQKPLTADRLPVVDLNFNVD